MKKILKIITVVVLCMVTVVPLFGCATPMETGYFKYFYCNEIGSGGWNGRDGDYVQICGLTELGREQEVLYVPDYINGKKVVAIYSMGEIWGGEPWIIESDVLKKVYLPRYIKFINQRGIAAVDIICNSELPFEYFHPRFINFYLSGEKYSLFLEHEEFKVDEWDLKIANTAFKLNYESANDYWVDNFAEGEKIVAPPQYPVRDGYTFDGWYTEQECTNKWDFENGTFEQLPQDEVTFKLYAKWINS